MKREPLEGGFRVLTRSRLGWRTTRLAAATFGVLLSCAVVVRADENTAAAAPAVQPRILDQSWGFSSSIVADAGAPPSTIDRTNLAGQARLLAPSMVGLIDRGWSVRVGPSSLVVLPSAFVEATAKYSGTVTFAKDSLNLGNYVAGLPFAQVDAADPDAAAKLILNFDAAAAIDDVEVNWISCDAGTLTAVGLNVEVHLLLDSAKRLSFIGRLERAPMPELQPNRDRVRYKEVAYPLIEPFDKKGVGMVASHYLDHLHPDDTWLYFPQLRRVRRLSTLQRSDPILSQDFDLDSIGGFSGNPAFFDWRLLGEATLLASFHAAEDRRPAKGPATPLLLPGEEWEPRSVWILEGRPKLAGYAYGKRVLYLDKESYRIPVTELYDRAGQLWKAGITAFRAPPALKAPAAPDVARESITSRQFGIFDLRLGRATVCEVPPESRCGSQRCPGWHINEGNVVEDQFSFNANLGGR